MGKWKFEPVPGVPLAPREFDGELPSYKAWRRAGTLLVRLAKNPNSVKVLVTIPGREYHFISRAGFLDFPVGHPLARLSYVGE